MWINILLTVLALFFAYQGAMLSFTTPFGSWTWVNVLVALFSVILLGIGIYDGIRAWKLWKIKAAKLNKQFEDEQAKFAAKRRKVYYDDTPDDPFAEGYVAKPSSEAQEDVIEESSADVEAPEPTHEEKPLDDESQSKEKSEE